MSKPSKVKIDVTKLLKQYFYKGQKGTYCTLVLWENRDGPDEFGNTHSAKQEIPKEARDAGEKEPYVGSAVIVTGDSAPRQPQQRRQSDRGFSRPQEQKAPSRNDDDEFAW